MRLLKLAADQPTFRTVEFNRLGLSFVMGAKKEPEDTRRNRTRTYNGVGKSLMIELIHFCLGSNKNDAFAGHLKDWTFSLTIEVDERNHVISRSAGRPGDITLDGEKVSLPRLREWLHAACFERVSEVQGLSFRSLISPFIRSGREAYERFDRASEGDAKNPYWPLVRNAFLLGLDLHLAQNKHDLRSRQTALAKTMKQLESDPLFAELLAEDKAGIELTALREDAARLEADLRAFRVAENYRSIQEEANALKREVEAARRELVKTSEAIAQIDRSLATRGDLDPGRVRQLYAEAEAALPERLQHKIEEVLAFQQELKNRRVFRLTSERQELERSRGRLQIKISGLAATLEERLRYLGSHVALDEYLAVNQRLNELRQRIAKLEASSEQRERVNRELKKIDLDLVTQSIQTDDYLGTARLLVEEANAMFRRFTKVLYGNRPSGLTVVNDEGENLTRYKIEAHISSDAAEGINEAKIFCYDLMVLALRRRHHIDFLIHDSSLFHPVDPRQRFAMLQLVDRMATELGIQYIATLNEHDVTSMTPTDPDEMKEFDRMFGERRVVLRLTDQSPRERLLGVEVDMNYWQKSNAA